MLMPISVPFRRLAPCDRPAPRRKQPRRGSRTRSPRPPVGRRVLAPACSELEWRLWWPLLPHRPRPPFSGNHAGRSPDPSCLPPYLRLDLMVPEVVSCLGQNAPFPVAAARLFDAGIASTHLESCNGLPTTKRMYSHSELADWSSPRVTSLVHNRGRSRARGRNPNAGATQRRRTNLSRAGSGWAPLFATSRKP